MKECEEEASIPAELAARATSAGAVSYTSLQVRWLLALLCGGVVVGGGGLCGFAGGGWSATLGWEVCVQMCAHVCVRVWRDGCLQARLPLTPPTAAHALCAWSHAAAPHAAGGAEAGRPVLLRSGAPC